MIISVPVLFLLSQVQGQQTLHFPAPRGIYQADLATCSEKDRDIYQAIFQGYLSIKKKDFEVSIISGTWRQDRTKLLLATEEFMEQAVRKPGSKFDDKTFLSGITLDVQPNGDLVLRPARGMYMTSNLTFRRIAPMKLGDALDETMKIDFEKKDYSFSLAWALTEQFYDMKQELAPQMLGVLLSDEPLPIRREAAINLWNVKGDIVVKTTGELLLAQTPSKDREARIFTRTLSGVLENSYHPSSAYFGMAAYKKGLISAYEVTNTISNSKNLDGIPLLIEIAEKAKTPSAISRVLEAMRKLSKPEGL